MKKYVLYILLGLILVALLGLFFTSANRKKRVFDERVTLRKNDKIPYGNYVAYQSLRRLFPESAVLSERREPGFWDSISSQSDRQALVIIAPSFNADEAEMNQLLSFVENGNDIFLSTVRLSPDAKRMIRVDVFSPGSDEFFLATLQDSMAISLKKKNGESELFHYPGKRIDGWFHRVDTSITTVMGYNGDGEPNFIKLRLGSGHFFVQLAPAAFTNYFALHRNNIAYLENAFSNISPRTSKLVWDEYYLARRPPTSKPDWLSVFLSYPAFRWAMLTAVFALLIFVLMEMRRKQRPIPPVAKPRNDSLEFVKTIGRLYHDRGDHLNLCRKMASYFLEHVRNRYKIPTTVLNEEFIKKLQFKTGVEEEEIREIVFFIGELDRADSVNAAGLGKFHRQLESFYKKA